MIRWPVVELFRSMQGEGALAGKISFFVRVGGCTFSCSWCDSMHAVDPIQIKAKARRLTADDIIEELCDMGMQPGQWVTLTGGDPALHNLEELVSKLKVLGQRVNIETQGALFKEWMRACDLITCSPKGPTSGMQKKFDEDIIELYRSMFGPKLIFKIVAFDAMDLDFAEQITRRFSSVPLYLTSGTQTHLPSGEIHERVLAGYKDIVEAVLERPLLEKAVVLPQLHVLLWGNELGR